MCRGVEARKGILGHQASDDSDIRRTRNLRPALSIHACTIDECRKDELASLALRRASEAGNDNGDRAERRPKDGDIVQGLARAHAEGIDEALREKDGGVDTDGLARCGYVVGTECTCG